MFNKQVSKVVIVHNYYGKLSGEESVVKNLAALLEARGITVNQFNRASTVIENKLLGKMAAFFSGIYNPFSKKVFDQFLKEKRPDVVHIHNLYPLISPSILPVCKAFGVPVVMTVHNYRLVCPNGLLLCNGEICNRCLGGKEYWCVLRNCENDFFKSTGYALRTAAARILRRYLDNVDHFICLSEFQKNILVGEGFPADRVSVLANPVSFDSKIPPDPLYKRGSCSDDVKIPPSPLYKGGEDLSEGMTKVGQDVDDTMKGMLVHPPSIPPLKGGKNGDDKGSGGYVAYVGRISPEKDVSTLIEAARRLSDLQFKFAGDYHRMPEVLKNKPGNCEFFGQLNAKEIFQFYNNARMVVFATRCYEGFPTVLLEAMSHGLPIVCSHIGGLPEIVEDGKTGLLYEPGNADNLANCIKTLWYNPDLCAKLGEAGRQKMREKYDAEHLLDKLLGIYGKVGGRRAEDGGRKTEGGGR